MTVVFLILAAILASDVQAKESHLTILAIGDSTTAGSPGFLSPLESPPAGSGNEQSQYGYWMTRRHPGWVVLNHGVMGQTSGKILKRFLRQSRDTKADVVVVLAGVNDLYRVETADTVKANLKKIYDAALAMPAKVVACTVLPYNRSTDEVKQAMSEVNGWIREYSRKRGLIFCDTFSVVSDPKNPGNLAGTPDGLHPDVEGYRKMGEAIAEVLEKS